MVQYYVIIKVFIETPSGAILKISPDNAGPTKGKIENSLNLESTPNVYQCFRLSLA